MSIKEIYISIEKRDYLGKQHTYSFFLEISQEVFSQQFSALGSDNLYCLGTVVGGYMGHLGSSQEFLGLHMEMPRGGRWGGTIECQRLNQDVFITGTIFPIQIINFNSIIQYISGKGECSLMVKFLLPCIFMWVTP